MTESSGDGRSRRQGGIESDRNEAGSEQARDQDAPAPVHPAPAPPAPPAPDADSAAAPAAEEPAARASSDQNAEPEAVADGAPEASASDEHAEPDAEALRGAEPDPEALGDAEPDGEASRDAEPDGEASRDADAEPEPKPAAYAEPAREPEPEPAVVRDSEREQEPESESEPGPEPASFSLFEPAARSRSLASPEHTDDPAGSDETQFVDLTTVEPPEAARPSGTAGPGAGDPTVVVITEPTLREDDGEAPEEDVPPPLPSAETVPPYMPPVYADPAYTGPAGTEPPHTEPPYTDPAYTRPRPGDPSPGESAYVERSYAEAAYTPGGDASSSSGPVPPEHRSDAGLPPAPGTDGVPLLEELPGGWQAVRRRHLRQTITFVVALLGVLGLGTLAGLMYTGRVAWPFGGRVNVSTQLCTPTPPLPPKQIHVRVYNGSSRSGLAKTVAAQLKALGFVVQETGNDPLEAKVTTEVEIRFGDEGEIAGKTASAYFAGKIRQRTDDRTNDVVDVVLGPKFKRVNTRREISRALVTVRKTMPLSCPPGVTPPPTPTPTPKLKSTPKPTPKPTPKH